MEGLLQYRKVPKVTTLVTFGFRTLLLLLLLGGGSLLLGGCYFQTG